MSMMVNLKYGKKIMQIHDTEIIEIVALEFSLTMVSYSKLY